MLKFLTVALDWVWNLKALQGHRHQVFRYLGLALAGYIALSEHPSSPLVGLPDVPALYVAAFAGWLSTKGIEFAKLHPKG